MVSLGAEFCSRSPGQGTPVARYPAWWTRVTPWLCMHRSPEGPRNEDHDSVGVAGLEPDEPVQTVPVDYLTVGCSPGTRLQIIHNPATF